MHLHGATDSEAVRRKLAEGAARLSGAGLMVAQGPGYALFDGRVPRLLLDTIMPDRPLALVADDHHTVWANTRALEQAGVLHGRETSDGHEVVMGDDGLANGTLLEPEAYAPVLSLSGYYRAMQGLAVGTEPDPAPTAAQRAGDLESLARGLAHANAHGVTSIVNMDGNLYTLDLLDQLRAEGRLTARVRVPFHFLPEMDEAELERASEMHARWNDEWLASGFVKLFMDGVIESNTAFMKADYPGRPGWRAHGRFPAERFARLATEIDRRGLQIAVHSIGDAATARVLDGYAAARRANGDSGLRHRIEHIELIDPADIPRLAELGVIASMQPMHVPGTGFPLQPAQGAIPPERWPDSYPVRRLKDAGVAIALASDWPVTDISVMRGFHAAVTRQSWCAEQADPRLTLAEALSGYTMGGAFAERTDTIKGSLTPGKLADVVILDGEIEAMDPGVLDRVAVRRTICGGRTVYKRP
ncbi:hypothetical protein SAMN04488239_10371 [Ruegeria marina]|uniref:Amidohydrolase 3 domain-containing protein n=1 Tax=Ruegeria marina TaxID=639004 RepID=A0A1G6N9B0_9RHOB|nr:hypothetical protein SAMN04488239_10371 [Ruegeria marina]